MASPPRAMPSLLAETRNTLRGNINTAALDLLATASLELSVTPIGEARAIAAVIPVGTPVYVNHSPKSPLSATLQTLVELRSAGLEPVPHLAARRLASRAEAETFLRQATGEAGVRKVLLLGGDIPEPVGPYDSGLALLREGLFVKYGIREIGLPGYPEGHPRIPAEALASALDGKLALASEQGIGTYLVTQFSFSPARIVEYCTSMARQRAALPIYVGLAGPTELRTLLRFAQLCGVSASLRALKDQGMNAVRLVTHTDPADQLAAVGRYCASHVPCNVVGVHLFSFGGALRTASWIAGCLRSLRRE